MILQSKTRVKFDPSKKAHRQAVSAFLKRNAWGDSPILFNYDPEYGSIADQVKAKMLTWYMNREMNRVAKPKIVKTATMRPFYQVS